MIDATPLLCLAGAFFFGMFFAFAIRKEAPPAEPIYKLVAQHRKPDPFWEWGEESEVEVRE